MIGYKAFDSDLKCRGFKFEIGQEYTLETPKDKMELCSAGVFHFCRYPIDIERNSNYSLANSRICEVIATGDVISNDEGKFGTNKLLILREIIGEEKNKLLHWNSGDRNSGYWNSGDRNSGDWNSGDWNSGYCNSDSPKVRMFNKMTKLNFNDITFPNYFYEVSPVRFISADTATYEQQKGHKKDIETCGGYYEKVEYKEAWRIAWNAASDEDRRKTLSLPNFDADVFFEISGIDVRKELNL